MTIIAIEEQNQSDRGRQLFSVQSTANFGDVDILGK